MRHNVNYMKVYCKVGDKIPVYPFPWRGEPFIGIVKKLKKNSFGRISYVIGNREIFTEELFPAIGQTKLKMRR